MGPLGRAGRIAGVVPDQGWCRRRTMTKSSPCSECQNMTIATGRSKLTTAIARNLELPSGKTDHIEWDEDTPGFGVRMRAGRKKVKRSWIYQYDFAGRTRRITIGNVIA